MICWPIQHLHRGRSLARMMGSCRPRRISIRTASLDGLRSDIYQPRRAPCSCPIRLCAPSHRIYPLAPSNCESSSTSTPIGVSISNIAISSVGHGVKRRKSTTRSTIPCMPHTTRRAHSLVSGTAMYRLPRCKVQASLPH